MNTSAVAFARAAQSLIGAPFRLHGRDPETGLDCIGLVAEALRQCGQTPLAPSGYSLRNSDFARYLAALQGTGFEPATGACKSGDLLLVRPSAGQFHLMIAALPDGFVHAHAGLGKVVHSPPPLQWPIERHWRLTKNWD